MFVCDAEVYLFEEPLLAVRVTDRDMPSPFLGISFPILEKVTRRILRNGSKYSHTVQQQYDVRFKPLGYCEHTKTRTSSVRRKVPVE